MMYTTNREKEKAFFDRLEREIKPKFYLKQWEHEKSFNELYDADEHFIQAWGGTRLDAEHQYEWERFSICLKEGITEEQWKEFCESINKEVEKIALEMLGESFVHFNRPYWDIGIHYNSGAVNKSEREEEERIAYEESEIGKFVKKHGYSPCEDCYDRNCKRCRYGDDGDYTIYDVYSPSELL